MKPRLKIAIILLFIAALIHIIGGEITDIKALLSAGMAKNITIEFRAVWYLAGIDFLISAIFLMRLIQQNKLNENKMLIDFIGIRMLLYGCAFFVLILFTDIKLLFAVPQWVLLLGIGGLLEWGEIIFIL